MIVQQWHRVVSWKIWMQFAQYWCLNYFVNQSDIPIITASWLIFYNAVLCNSLKVPRKKSVRVRFLDFLLDDFCNLRPSRKRLLEAGLLHAVLVQPAIRTDYRVRRGKLARRRVWFDSASTASGFPHVGVLVRGQQGQTWYQPLVFWATCVCVPFWIMLDQELSVETVYVRKLNGYLRKGRGLSRLPLGV